MEKRSRKCINKMRKPVKRQDGENQKKKPCRKPSVHSLQRSRRSRYIHSVDTQCRKQHLIGPAHVHTQCCQGCAPVSESNCNRRLRHGIGTGCPLPDQPSFLSITCFIKLRLPIQETQSGPTMTMLLVTLHYATLHFCKTKMFALSFSRRPQVANGCVPSFIA